jgi:hypothetical protein
MRCDQYGMHKNPKIPKNHNKFSFKSLPAGPALMAAQKIADIPGFSKLKLWQKLSQPLITCLRW